MGIHDTKLPNGIDIQSAVMYTGWLLWYRTECKKWGKSYSIFSSYIQPYAF